MASKWSTSDVKNDFVAEVTAINNPFRETTEFQIRDGGYRYSDIGPRSNSGSFGL